MEDKVDNLLGVFLLSRDIKNDSFGERIKPHSFYNLSYDVEKEVWVVIPQGIKINKN